MAYHAKLSPSSAERWMGCPGSVALAAGIPDIGSTYADEGTAAHFLAADCLMNGYSPDIHIGRHVIVADSGTRWMTDAGKDRGESAYEVTEDMAAHVAQYVAAVNHFAEGGTLFVEQRVSISTFTGEADATGTADAIVITPEGELQVHDLKYGFRTVSAKSNKQLMLYGLGAIDDLSMLYDITGLRVFIHQPRVHSGAPSEYVVGAEELDAFDTEVRASAELALSGQGGLVPSEAACEWCRAKATCPELASFVEASVGANFEDMGALELTNVDTPAVKLSAKMAAIPLIEDWAKAVRAEVEARLFAGEVVDGFKVVQGRRGKRTWADPSEAEKLLKDTFRLKVEEMYDLKLISPTTADKLHKGETPVIGPRQWKKVEALITQRDGLPSVAPESDPRPPLSIAAKVEDFTNLDDGSDLL